MFFEYSNEQLCYLKSVDKKMELLIDEIGIIERNINPNHFLSLVNQIIGQQISNNASLSIRKKFMDLLNDVTPSTILSKSDEELRSCGLSMRKVEYIKNISLFALENQNFFENIYSLSDDEIYNSLISIKGIGQWTIEMFLIFSLNRENVFSYNDLVIKKSLARIHGLVDMDKVTFEKYRVLYSPYCSIASLYLWELNSRKDLEHFPF